MAKTLFNISDKIVAGNAPGELLAYRDRIIADGGTLETFAETEAEIRRLQSLGLYDSLSLGYVAGGYKASKWYNIKGATGDLDVVRATNGTRQNRAGLINTLGNNLTRADFDSGVLKGNWVESAATNLALASEEFDNSYWIKQQGGTGLIPVVTPNVATAPDGTETADRVLFDQGAGTASGDRSLISSSSISVTVQSYTASLFIKADTADDIGKQLVIRHVGAASFGVITLTADWQRFDRTESSSIVGSRNFTIGVRTSQGGNASQVSVLLWGAQLETGSRASTYIKTTTATATRNADNISKTGIASEIGQTQGVIYAEVDLSEGMSGKEIVSLTDSSDSANRNIRIFMNSNFNLTAQYRTGTGTNSIVSSYNNVGVARIALAYKDNDPNGIRIFCNGINLENRSTDGMLATMSRLYVGRRFGLGNYFNDRIYSTYHWKTAKTDAELIALTTL